MSSKNPNQTRSLTSYRTFYQKKAKKIDDFLRANSDPNSEDLQELKKLNSDLEDQLKRMETAWESMMDDTDNDTFNALNKMLNEVSEEVAKTLGASKKIISEKSASPNVVQSTITATSSGPPKNCRHSQTQESSQRGNDAGGGPTVVQELQSIPCIQQGCISKARDPSPKSHAGC